MVYDDFKKVEGRWTDDGGENEVRVVSIFIMMVVRLNDLCLAVLGVSVTD